MGEYRNRIIERRVVPVAELRLHPKNWKVHGTRQRDVLGGILEKIGIVDSLLAYHSAREGGALTLINGHLRQGMGGSWPVEITDLTDEEADLILSTFDPSTNLAEMDSVALADLLAGLQLAPADEGESAEALLGWLEEMAEDAAVMESTKLTDAKAGGGRNRGNYGATVKLVLVAEDVYDVERALAATEQRNRADAILEVCRYYLENHAKGQQYTRLEGLAAAQPAARD